MSHAATNWAIKQRGLKPAAKIVLWHLCDRFNPDNGCFVSQEKLARDCEMSRSALNHWLNVLEEATLIRRVAKRNPTTQRQERTEYFFPFQNEEQAENMVEGPSRESGHGAVSRKSPEPSPDFDESRVRNPDSNLVREPVREPVKDSRESARARESGEQPQTEPPRRWDFVAPDDPQAKACFDQLVDVWRRFAIGGAGAIGDSAKALAAIGDLSETDRSAAIERAPRYHRAQKDAGRSRAVAIATYVKNREFDHHPPPRNADPSDLAPIEFKPYVTPLWAMYWKAVHKARQAAGDEHLKRRLRDCIGWLERGVSVPAANAPIEDETRELVAIRVDGPEYAAWAEWCLRAGTRLPKPDHVPVIYVLAAYPPPLTLSGAKPYRLALPARIEVRGPAWWWRFHKRLEDGSPIVGHIGVTRFDLLDAARRLSGSEEIDYGPLPLPGEVAAMVEVKTLTDAFEQWSTWVAMRGGDLAMWPHGSIWCPTRYPTLIFGQGKQREGAAA